MPTKIKISQEECLELEKLHYEVNARKGLLSYLVTFMKADKTSFQSYHDEYIFLFRQYDKLKFALSQKYVIPLYPNNDVTWDLDFDTCELTIIQKL